MFPIQWPEPFGLVMLESMAAGTPVIAIKNGAVPEVIEDGRSGFVVNGIDEMAAAVDKVASLSPFECRAYVEARFSPEKMVGDYEKAYQRILEIRAGQAA